MGSPPEHVVVERRWKYAPPPWVVYEAIVEQTDRWLVRLAGEAQPQLVDARRPDAIVFRPWLGIGISSLEVRIEADGQGSSVTLRAYSELEALEDEARRQVRHRLGTLFGAGLRDWVDEPHWT